MSFLRRIPLSRLILLCAAVVVAGAGVAVAASLGGAPKPAPQPLANAVHDALVAPPVQGVSARISFTNNLIASSSGVQGRSPLLNGATGRLWASRDGRLRLELQSDRGDVQIVYDGQTISYVDGSGGTVYRFTLPSGGGSAHERGADKPASANRGVPTVDQIQGFLTRLMQHATLSGAVPDDVAGRPAYHVTISPGRDGGLIGGAGLWWDAVHGIPLRLTVYAAHRSDPVLELTATQISYGPVAASVFSAPTGAKVVQVRAPAARTGAAARAGAAHARGHPARRHAATGRAAVAAALPFTLAAPSTLSGLSLSEVRLLDWGGHPAALVTYGEGLGGLAVVERQADTGGGAASGADSGSGSSDGHGGTPTLPSIQINGAYGHELVTALGSVVEFQRSGVDYIVAGSVSGPVVEAAARSL